MPPEAATIEPVTGAVRGAVDNIGREKIYGWAWHPDRPAERLRVEARLGRQVVLETRADIARADLHGAGVGDGSHAFELRLTPECLERRHELFIVAIAADGSEATLPFRVPRTPAMAAAAEAKRELGALAAARALLRDEMKAVRTHSSALEGTAAGLAATQARLEDRLGTLELWLTRLDGRLAAMAEPSSTQRPRRDGWQTAFGVVLALTGGAGLGVSLLLLGPGLLSGLGWPF